MEIMGVYQSYRITRFSSNRPTNAASKNVFVLLICVATSNRFAKNIFRL
jgi:hypothetical protein